MPQEFIVTRCFSCETFQVHQVRKDSKFLCKICGLKQSRRKVYAQGNGKDCRRAVQLLSMREFEKIEKVVEDFETSFSERESFAENITEVNAPLAKRSKWDPFIDDQCENEDFRNVESLSLASSELKSEERVDEKNVGKRFLDGTIKKESSSRFLDSSRCFMQNKHINVAYQKFQDVDIDMFNI